MIIKRTATINITVTISATVDIEAPTYKEWCVDQGIDEHDDSRYDYESALEDLVNDYCNNYDPIGLDVYESDTGVDIKDGARVESIDLIDVEVD